MRRALLAGFLLPFSTATAQGWNSDAALTLVRRAIERRTQAAGDTTLRDYKAQAHGFLFFLGQFGEGLAEPPRLVRADQLELEVYWKAPGLSKQRIIGWRDKAELPTDIVYHRDHLGIVQNNFGAAIRVGEGDEVRDVPHPLAPAGPDLYDYELGDTTTLTLPQRVVRVIAVRVRPKDWNQPRIIGSLYLDATTAELVRMGFNFTAKAYLQRDLEDVSIVLDNALWEDRYWLPYRQEIEIRRRGNMLDMPVRGIIRSRWEVDSYQLNLGLAASWFVGEEITALPKAERDSFPWTEPLAAAIAGVAKPLEQSELANVRAEVERMAQQHAVSGLRRNGLGARGASDLVRFNRVEGLALGAGFVLRPGSRTREIRALVSYGFSDQRVKGMVTARMRNGRRTLGVNAYRMTRDVGDVPVIAPILNSFSSQELGDDYGDYYLANGARAEITGGLGARAEWSANAGRETILPMMVVTTPTSGTFRPNPALAATGVDVLELALGRRGAGFSGSGDLHGELVLEGGRLDGGNTYARAAARGQTQIPLGSTRALVRVETGVGSADLPAHRAFVLGGRGTLLGDDFRRWGGRRMALVHLEWRVPVPFFSLKIGPATRTPRSIILAPFAATGWAGRSIAGTPWNATPGARVTLGVAAEWLGILRLESGMDTHDGRFRFAFDLTRDFWDIL